MSWMNFSVYSGVINSPAFVVPESEESRGSVNYRVANVTNHPAEDVNWSRRPQFNKSINIYLYTRDH